MKNPFLLGFCALVISALLWPAIPPAPVGMILPFVALLLYRRAALLAGATAGIGWVVLFTLMTFDYRHVPEGRDVWIRAEIITPVSASGDWQSIDIQLIKPKLISLPEPRIRLDWRRSEQVVAGEVWEFKLARRSISGPLNDGGFNQQRYLLSRHIGLKARVLDARRVTQSASLRQQIIGNVSASLFPKTSQTSQTSGRSAESAQHVSQHADQTAGPALLLALMTGVQSEISQASWEQLRATGTGHLIAISGLHLTVIAIWLFALSRYGLGLFSSPQDRRNLLFASAIALLGCLLYALLAGMGVPTRRAFVMLALVCLLTLSRRFASPWERLLYALFAVLLLDPLSAMAAGFWLSFGAIAIILLCLPAKVAQTDGLLAKLWLHIALLVKMQLALSLGMGVMQLMLFGGLSIHSLWINLLMVPWYSFVVIPLSLFSLLLFLLSNSVGFDIPWIFEPALLSLIPHQWLLTLSGHLPAAWLQLSEALSAALIFIVPAIGLLIMPRLGLPLGRGFKVLALCLLLPLAAWRFGQDKSGFEVHLLDVGQGLSVVVFQDEQTLVYDTGAAFSGGYSYGERVLLPFLAAKGRERVDVLVISHEDNDHAGGAQALASTLPVIDIISDTKMAASLPSERRIPCQPLTRAFGTLTLEVLDSGIQDRLPLPEGGDNKRERIGNNHSCVVRLSDSRHSLLLTGDIEIPAEVGLLKSGQWLDADIMTAPHHGSKTSSSTDFIAAVSPQFTLFAAGINNRYGFPKPEVVNRYLAAGSTPLVSADSGQISFYLDEVITVKTFRGQLAPFWYNRVFGVGDLPITE